MHNFDLMNMSLYEKVSDLDFFDHIKSDLLIISWYLTLSMILSQERILSWNTSEV